jgi:hypothetical protein
MDLTQHANPLPSVVSAVIERRQRPSHARQQARACAPPPGALLALFRNDDAAAVPGWSACLIRSSDADMDVLSISEPFRCCASWQLATPAPTRCGNET